MPNVTANKLIDLLRRSKLIEEQRLDKFLEKTVAEHGSGAVEDQERLATLLVEAGLVTRWQADKLLAGKHKGFRLGKYKLLDQIGKGGMSSVYLAEHELMKRRVAIKVLPKQRVGDASYLERFRLEARAVAKLDDPNIVRAYDIDNEGDIHYIVMEYVEGKDLHQIVSQYGPLEYEAAADYIAQVANGLDHAHDMGLVHRDIKPANCLVDRNQTVKLLDLGLAKLNEDEQTSLTLANEENVLGTADYLAPEQALNSHTADHRADIYSLGCTFYFLLTGRPPFPEGSISERLLKHQTAMPDSIFKTRPDAPPSLIEICERMMAKKPEERQQTAAEVSKRLTSWLSERGRTLGGGRVDDGEHEVGVGSGILSRFSVATPTPPPVSTPESDTISSRDRDTAKLVDSGSGTSALDEDIGLAPLDEEAEAAKEKKTSDKVKPPSSKKLSDSAKLAAIQSPVSSGKSLVEEELEETMREQERLARLARQRAEFNPLNPPGYTGSRSNSWVLWAILGGGGLLLLAFVLILILANI